MAIISKITALKTTELFWDTLEPYRKTQHYEMLRKQIADLVVLKKEGKKTSHRDKVFNKKSGGDLVGIWHTALSRNPDVVLFYTIDDTTMKLAMLGNHSDYSSDGRNFNTSTRTAQRIRNALQKSNAGKSNVKRVYLKNISFLLNSTELYEMPRRSLETLMFEIEEEMDNAEMLQQRYKLPIEDIPEEVFYKYIDDLDELHNHCNKILHSKQLTPEKYLEHVYSTSKTHSLKQ